MFGSMCVISLLTLEGDLACPEKKIGGHFIITGSSRGRKIHAHFILESGVKFYNNNCVHHNSLIFQ